MDQTLQVKVIQTVDFLHSILKKQLPDAAEDWIAEKLLTLRSNPNPRDLYLFFGAVTRKMEKSTIQFTDDEILKASELRNGWTIEGWDTVLTSRIIGLLSFPAEEKSKFLGAVEQLYSTADVDELVALYHALPLMPYPDDFRLRAAEGIRTNMTVVFDAVALQNPYPHDFLDDNAWNQMILKAMFMDRPLYRIWGIDNRSNIALSQMISDFAHERWVAGRDTSPEMWRPVKSDTIPALKEDLIRLLESGDRWQQSAAILASRDLPAAWQQELNRLQFKLIDKPHDLESDWDTLGKNWWKFKGLSQN